VRVAVIFHRFGPYHCARLEAASRYCNVTGIEVAAQSSEYDWSPVGSAKSYDRVTLFSAGDTRAMPAAQIAKRIGDALRVCGPTAVAIPGWSDNAANAALRWCIRNAVPAILMSESTAQDEPRIGWREWIKRRIVGLHSTALVGGQRHIDYLINLGMPRDRVFTGYDVVDNEYFRRKAAEVRRQKPEVRQKYQLPENYFLASARFIEKKNLLALLCAYADYRERSSLVTDHSPWHLVLLGDGPLKSDLQRLISDLGLHEHVHLPGFKQYYELPVYYGFAKAFVHASKTEQWGLVVNEAIAAGLPVIVSNRCGCVPELVRDNVNGFTFDPGSTGNLTTQLTAMFSMPKETRERFAHASTEIAQNFQTDRFGQGLKRAAELAISLPSKSATFFDQGLLFAVMGRRA
jgi:glycosyltransferase involved in cell wall biosynthesis